MDAAEAAEASMATKEDSGDPSSSILFQRLSSSSNEEDLAQGTSANVKGDESENELDPDFDEEDSFEGENSEDDESRLIIDEGRSASRSRSANSNEVKVAKVKGETTDLEPGEVPPSQVNSEVKSEVKSEFDFEDDDFETKPVTESDPPVKKRRKHNRFNGMSEEEVAKKKLPDVIKPELDILIVSI